VGTLTMVVAEKTREIGILGAMGFSPGAVGRVFLLQGAVIGATGVALGVILGLGVSLGLDKGRWIRINPSIYFIDHLPVHVEALDVVLIVVASLLLTLTATVPPSRSASRLMPVEAIRYE
jgi:lipoprotein-releasing system permease protein